MALHKRGEEYEIVFDSRSPLMVLHRSVYIFCDPSNGLHAYATPTGNRISHDNDSHDELPHDILKSSYDIRRSFGMENARSDHLSHAIVLVLPSLPLLNAGN